MDSIKLEGKNIFDPNTEFHYAFFSTVINTAAIHCHDFFEIFLITHGKVIHNVNDEKQFLTDGDLVLIRPNDVHCYEKDGDEDCQFINLAFSHNTMDSLYNYLGSGFPYDNLMKPKLPPRIILSNHEKNKMISKLSNLNTIPMHRKDRIKAQSRALLIEIFMKYFTTDHEYKGTEMPQWFKSLCSQMEKVENFTEGILAIHNISGKSHEHLCRTFKKYLNMTPTEYINELRLNYAANLLINTDNDIITLSLECGFQNLSHFYHLFKRRFGMPPADFRRKYQRAVIT